MEINQLIDAYQLKIRSIYTQSFQLFFVIKWFEQKQYWQTRHLFESQGLITFYWFFVEFVLYCYCGMYHSFVNLVPIIFNYCSTLLGPWYHFNTTKIIVNCMNRSNRNAEQKQYSCIIQLNRKDFEIRSAINYTRLVPNNTNNTVKFT